MNFIKSYISVLLVIFCLTACASTEPVSNAANPTIPVTLPSETPGALGLPTPDRLPVDTPEVEGLSTPTPPVSQTLDPSLFSPSASEILSVLAGRLGVSVDELAILSFDEVAWPDGCLGAAKPAELCTQAIVDGYRIILQVNGKSHEFHTDLDGAQVREVTSGSPIGKNILMGAVAAARQSLAKNLGVNISQVKLQSAKPVDWPDSCLGLAQPDQACAEVITPGYRIVFIVAENQYEVHTDQSGVAVGIVSASVPQVSAAVLIWEWNKDGTCHRLEAGKTIAVGKCGSPLVEIAVVSARTEELNALTERYSAFTAETKAGKIEWKGQGSQKASLMEQRSIAEWARMVYQESQTGSTETTDEGLLISWHRSGGIAGFCDDLTVYASGWAHSLNCRSADPESPRVYRLTAQEIERVFAWADKLSQFDYEQSDPAVADAMTVKLVFKGSGAQIASPDQQQEILVFAQGINNQASQ